MIEMLKSLLDDLKFLLEGLLLLLDNLDILFSLFIHSELLLKFHDLLGLLASTVVHVINTLCGDLELLVLGLQV